MNPNLTDYGIVLAGHGSRDADGVREFESIVDLLKERASARTITHGFLEFAKPTIDEAAKANVQKGSRRVAIVPGVLLAATHAKNDMPAEVLVLQRDFPDVTFHYGAPLHFHPLILKLSRERIIQAEAQSAKIIKRSDACLVVVGRGTTDPDANSDVSKLARILEEGLGFGASFVCYSGTANPLVADGLQAAARLGFSRIVVFPFFLFTGILVKRIYAAADDLQRTFPKLDVVQAPYLGVHPHVADALIERAEEAVQGQASMNCSLCKYRTQIVGYEQEVGTPQQGHHFHVRATCREPVAEKLIVLKPARYIPHPIEVKSFEVIENNFDWSAYEPLTRAILQRIVHTSGDFEVVKDIFISSGADEAGLRALLKGTPILTDVTMVQSGLRRTVLDQLGLLTSCMVHDEETRLLAKASGLTRSAAGIRRGWERFGNNVIVAIGDAPTAVEEALRLVREQKWSPHLIVGLPVGFIGTQECKEKLRRCLQINRITNRGTRGGSPWAAAVINALLITAINRQTVILEESPMEKAAPKMV
jgi:precorrin-8X/cobalt-precorrin-8 methylmutase